MYLTNEALDKLVLAVKDGDKDSFGLIAAHFTPYIKGTISALNLAVSERDDIFQESSLALYNAVLSYNPTKGALFSTWAWICIRSEILSAARRLSRKKNRVNTESLSIDTTEQDETFLASLHGMVSSDPQDDIISAESYQSFLRQIEDILTRFEKQVFELYIAGYTYREISQSLGKPLKSVDNAVYRIKSKLKTLK
ncbi:MAG: sigma-70 family RNA polymerase sigma factor [Eubacteriales bacterium]